MSISLPSDPLQIRIRRDALVVMIMAVSCLVFPLAAAGDSAPLDFHIDPGSGDDANDGLSPATAWKTANALSGRALSGGTRVLFRAGSVHAGTVSLSPRGNAGKPVVVGRYGNGPAPVINGRGATSAMIISDPDHLVVEDLEITNRSPQPGARNGIVVSANDGTSAHNIVLRRLHVHHVSGHDERNGGCGILLGSGRSSSGSASRYEDLRIEDCLLHDLPFNGILVSGWETRGRNQQGELQDPSTGIVIRGNLLHDIAGDAICIITTRGAIIEHNEVYRSSLGQVRGERESPSAGIWPHSSDGTIMRFNRVEGLRGGKDGQAFDVDFDCRNTLIENNFTRDNGTGFLLVCSGGGDGRKYETMQVVVRNNLCWNECAEPPGALFTFISRVRGIHVENNAFVFEQEGERRFLRLGNWLDPSWPADITFSRNLIISAGSLYNENGPVTSIRFEGNLEVGDLRFGAAPDDRNPAQAELIGALGKSFTATVTENPSIKDLGFKPFDPMLAGLPPGSRLLANAREERRAPTGIME
jgi:hypothetical protein